MGCVCMCVCVGHCRGSGGPPSSSAPANPQVAQSRSLRWEQDQAYEESLAADRCVTPDLLGSVL